MAESVMVNPGQNPGGHQTAGTGRTAARIHLKILMKVIKFSCRPAEPRRSAAAFLSVMMSGTVVIYRLRGAGLPA